MEKKIIINAPGETQCDNLSVAEFHKESGFAEIKNIKSDSATFAAYYTASPPIENEDGFCFVRFKDENSDTISLAYHFISSLENGKRKIVATVTNLTPETIYEKISMSLNMIVPNGSHKAYLQYIPEFQTLSAPIAPTLITKINSVDSTSATIDCTTNPGSNEAKEPYKFFSKIVLYYKNNPIAAFSDSVPSSKREQTTTIKLDGLVPNQEYDMVWASVLTNYNFGKGYLFADDKIENFTTEDVKTIAPSFTQKDLSVKENDLTINYVLDLGSDRKGDPYQLRADVDLYDQDGNLLDSKNDSTGTFKIEDLANGEYSGWYLSAKTSYGVKAITAELDDFTIEFNQIVAPSFTQKDLSVKENDLTINYILDLGSDRKGDPYQLRTDVELYDQDGNLLDSKNDSTATFKIEDLANGEYSGWYLSAKTSYGVKAITAELDDFTIEFNQIVAPSFTQKDLSVKENDLTINYILDLGSDRKGDPYQLRTDVELYDQDGNLLDSKNDSTATFKIEDLANGEYSGWYLSAKTSYGVKAITAELDDFSIDFNQIVTPSFTRKDLSVKENDVTIDYILDLGSDQKGDPYQLRADVELYDQNGNLLDSKSDSTATFNIKDLANGEYSGWYLSAKTSYGVKAITAELDDFTIEFNQIVAPSFTQKDLSVKENDVTIDYVLDLGSDRKGDPYQLRTDVELYDQDGNLLDSKSDSTATFNIKDLANGEYSGWYLSAKTSYSLEKIIAKLRPFIIRNSCSNIKPPYFKCNEIKVCQDLVKVSYKINSGTNQTDEEYKLIGWIVLVDDIGCVRAYCDKMEGNLIADNLTPNTTYSNWYISAYTTYSDGELIEELEDFTTA